MSKKFEKIFKSRFPKYEVIATDMYEDSGGYYYDALAFLHYPDAELKYDGCEQPGFHILTVETHEYWFDTYDDRDVTTKTAYEYLKKNTRFKDKTIEKLLKKYERILEREELEYEKEYEQEYEEMLKTCKG